MKHIIFILMMFFPTTACIIDTTMSDTLSIKSVIHNAKKSVVALGYYDITTDMFYPMGTGYVWDTSGHIVTNLHVVDAVLSTTISVDIERSMQTGTNTITMTQPMFIVMFEDTRMFRADLINFTQNDYEKNGPDIALLKLRKTDNFLIRATKKEILQPNGKMKTEIVKAPSFVTLQTFLYPIKYHPKYQNNVGDTVYAIGHPQGLLFTVTKGIISNIRIGFRDTNYIQTDASINPGNSGGLLINEHGYFVGMNTLIYSAVGESNGLGFAIENHVINHNIQKWLEIEAALSHHSIPDNAPAIIE